MAAMRGDQTS